MKQSLFPGCKFTTVFGNKEKKVYFLSGLLKHRAINSIEFVIGV